MATFEEEAEKGNIKNIVIMMILSALGFLVALAWRDAIQKSIEQWVPAREGLSYMYLVATLVTVIAVVISYILIKIQKANIVPDQWEERLKVRKRGEDLAAKKKK